ncbi:Type 1 glutamine amidotransferase-like domain-containing protein [Gordonia soli]|uniref:Peptidase S51 family protein n=1 Tax=Gordonia soli NBRC 108243 TaxID=1223545 RepID=M0QI33_9ACTN|nr:Type 1 glutamine amidotransferase-like domain-containing protein [Gordonia soli]GAC67946.1 hypothetical protein GS4_11_02150 [Gordonia soli NBRC 108243]
MLLASRWLSAVPDFVNPLVERSARSIRIGFIGAASEIYPQPGWLGVDREALRDFGFEVIDIDLGRSTPESLDTALDAVDAVFVAGGNTFHLLHVLRRTGTDAVLTRRVRDGLPYIGESAGSVVVGPDLTPIAGMDDPGETEPLDSWAALGLVDIVVIPHADGIVMGTAVIDETRRNHGDDDRLVYIDDDQAVRVSDSSWSVVSSG